MEIKVFISWSDKLKSKRTISLSSKWVRRNISYMFIMYRFYIFDRFMHNKKILYVGTFKSTNIQNGIFVGKIYLYRKKCKNYKHIRWYNLIGMFKEPQDKR